LGNNFREEPVSLSQIVDNKIFKVCLRIALNFLYEK
jgi:hypothetical protein